MKCDAYAEGFLLDAKRFFDEGKFEDSLAIYNQCLRFADRFSELLTCAYTGRAMIFKVLNRPQKCLENIKLAIDAADSQEKANELKYFRDKCKESFTEISSDDDVGDFFKVSATPHPNIPFIDDSLEVQENKTFVRFIAAKRDLRLGEIVAVEEPFYKVLDVSQRHLRCAVCLKQNMLSLLPCDNCKFGE